MNVENKPTVFKDLLFFKLRFLFSLNILSSCHVARGTETRSLMFVSNFSTFAGIVCRRYWLAEINITKINMVLRA